MPVESAPTFTASWSVWLSSAGAAVAVDAAPSAHAVVRSAAVVERKLTLILPFDRGRRRPPGRWTRPVVPPTLTALAARRCHRGRHVRRRIGRPRPRGGAGRAARRARDRLARGLGLPADLPGRVALRGSVRLARPAAGA